MSTTDAQFLTSYDEIFSRSSSKTEEERALLLKKRKVNALESEKESKQRTLNAKRCRSYRQRKKVNKIVSLASTSVTTAVDAGSSSDTTPSKNALYCQRYRKKKKMQQRGNTSLIPGSSLIINEQQEAMVEKETEESEKEAEQVSLNAKRCRTYRQRKKVNQISLASTSGTTAVDAGFSFETAPSKNALYCQRYRNKKSMKQRRNTLLITGSSLMINEKQEAKVEKYKEGNMRTYKRKTNRQHWSEFSMKNAIEACLSGKCGYQRAAKQYNVPRSTLRDRVKTVLMAGKNATEAAVKGMGRYKTVFSKKQEKELVSYVIESETELFGLTVAGLRRVAYQLAQRNGVAHNFNNETQEAGKDWVRGFLQRHPKLSLRTPQTTSAARAMGFNRTSVQKFFHSLASVYNRYKFPPIRIFNCDETAMSIVAKTKSKITTKSDRRQVESISLAEHDKFVTAEICFSAAGAYIPPLLIFPRPQMNVELLNGTPPGTIGVCNKSGRMESEIFVKWLHHFVRHTKPSAENPVLLLVDGNVSHTKNDGAVDLARKNHVILVWFPPYCSQRLQPSDVGFMAPLSAYYDQEIKNWLKTNPGQVVTEFEIGKLFGIAYTKTANLETAINAFAKPGIWPLNENAFTDTDFTPFEVIEQENPSEVIELENPNAISDEAILVRVGQKPQTAPPNTSSNATTSSTNYMSITKESKEEEEIDISLPGCSNTSFNIEPEINNSLSGFSNTNFKVQPDSDCPISQNTYKESTRRRGTSAILTSISYQDELEQQPQKRYKLNSEESKKPVRSKIISSSSSDSESYFSDDDDDDDDDDSWFWRFCPMHWAVLPRRLRQNRQNIL